MKKWGFKERGCKRAQARGMKNKKKLWRKKTTSFTKVLSRGGRKAIVQGLVVETFSIEW